MSTGGASVGVSHGSVLIETAHWSRVGFSPAWLQLSSELAFDFSALSVITRDPDGLLSGFTPGWTNMGSFINRYPPGSNTVEGDSPDSVCWSPAVSPSAAGGHIRKENVLVLARKPFCAPFPGTGWILGAMNGKGAGFKIDLVI